MRILMIHNYYQRRGGEDESTEQEVRLLRNHGHDVRLYSRHNAEIEAYSLFRKGYLFFAPTWSWKSYREVKRIIEVFNPEIAHFQNFFPLVSPSAHLACAEGGVPIVQSLRNYRLLCPVGSFFRDGRVCEECMKHSLWRGIRYGCYHDSPVQTASVSLMIKFHRLLNTWQEHVDAFIALTEFSRRKFIEGGLQPSKLYVRPNFLDKDSQIEEESRGFGVFVGRLSEEKGVYTLLNAWRALPDVSLKVIGDGPLRDQLQTFVRQHAQTQVEFVGFIPSGEVLDYLKKAFFLIMPSVWYETFGRTIIEAYATGTPVIASRLGAMADLVDVERTGLLFEPGNLDDLVTKVRYALENPNERRRWGQEARRTFEQRFSADAAYENLMEIYAQVV